MHISIDTSEEITDLDRQVLGILAGGTFTLNGEPQQFTDEVYAGTDEEGEDVYEPEEEPEPEPEPKSKPAAKKTAAKKAAKKPAPEPEPEPEPEPMAEEPVEEEAGDEGEGFDEDQSDEDLLALAIKKATEMVGSGDAAKVREALDAAGANRVRELNSDNVREFFRALS